jgi:hypothetical protein
VPGRFRADLPNVLEENNEAKNQGKKAFFSLNLINFIPFTYMLHLLSPHLSRTWSLRMETIVYLTVIYTMNGKPKHQATKLGPRSFQMYSSAPFFFRANIDR